MNIKRLTAAALAFVLAAGLAGCGQTETEETTQPETSSSTAIEDDYVLKIGETQGALCHAPLQVAMELGYFDEEGIQWERVDFGAGDIQAALGAGSIDAGFGLVGKFVQPIENGLNMVITSGMHTGCTKLLVTKDSGINSVEDLKGKTIGVSSLAGSEAVTTKRSLSAAGIDISPAAGEVEFAVYSTTDLPIALVNGAIDAITVFDPVATTAEKEYDLRVIIDTATDEAYKNEYCCVSFVSSQVAEEHPEIAAAFTRAVLKGAAYVAAHPEETAQLQIDKEYVSGDLALNTEILKSYKFIPSVQGGYDALAAVAYDLQNIGVLKSTTDVDALVEKSFAFFSDVPDTYTMEGDTFTSGDCCTD